MYATDVECHWTLVDAPNEEPVTVGELKMQARITHDEQDALLDSYIKAAREEAESYMGRGLLTQIWQMTLSDFADVMPLPMAAPLRVVTIASVDYPKVQYYDANGTLQTLATTIYDTDLIARPGRIVLKAGQSWPTLQSLRQSGRVVITYVVGEANATDIPERIKQGIRLYASSLDADRDGMELTAQQAREAAYRCWGDRVYWTPPQLCGLGL